jgi:hypothetical protein
MGSFSDQDMEWVIANKSGMLYFDKNRLTAAIKTAKK